MALFCSTLRGVHLAFYFLFSARRPPPSPQWPTGSLGRLGSASRWNKGVALVPPARKAPTTTWVGWTHSLALPTAGCHAGLPPVSWTLFLTNVFPPKETSTLSDHISTRTSYFKAQQKTRLALLLLIKCSCRVGSRGGRHGKLDKETLQPGGGKRASVFTWNELKRHRGLLKPRHILYNCQPESD